MNSTKQIRIPLFDLRVLDPNLRDELMEAFTKVLDHGRLFGGGLKLDKFKDVIATEIDMLYATSVALGSSIFYTFIQVLPI